MFMTWKQLLCDYYYCMWERISCKIKKIMPIILYDKWNFSSYLLLDVIDLYSC